jgi:dipeptide/tripeptide permease
VGRRALPAGVFGHAIPASFLISLDAIVSTTLLIAVVAFWRWWSTFRPEPDEITKITFGIFMAALAPLCLALGAMHEAATGRRSALAGRWAFTSSTTSALSISIRWASRSIRVSRPRR